MAEEEGEETEKDELGRGSGSRAQEGGRRPA